MEGELLLVVGAILLLAVAGAFLAQRSGVPLLVAFLALGMADIGRRVAKKIGHLHAGNRDRTLEGIKQPRPRSLIS